MNVKMEQIEKNVVQLEIEVDAVRFDQGLQKSFIKNASRFNIPGFRKGKAPRKMVERYYGEQVLYEDAINIVCSEAYDEAVEQNNIFPVDRPAIDIKEIGAGKNLIFTATVVVKPEVELGEYIGVEVNKIQAIVTEEEVEKELQSIVEKNARMIAIEDRPVEKGDTIIMDFEGFIDGEVFEDSSAENYSLVVGTGNFIDGFEDQLIGVNREEAIEVNVTFPETYQKEELQGKSAMFKVTIHEIKAKELPAIDDEFAMDVSEFDTLEEYKKSLYDKLLHSAENKAEHDLEDAVVNKAVENAIVEIPDVMTEKRIDAMMYDFDSRLRYQGMDLNKYLEVMGIDSQAFRFQYKNRAAYEVKTQMVLEKVSVIEGIEASDEEFNEEINKMSETYQKTPEELKLMLKEDDASHIKGSIVIKKTIDYLVKSAKVV